MQYFVIGVRFKGSLYKVHNWKKMGVLLNFVYK